VLTRQTAERDHLRVLAVDHAVTTFTRWAHETGFGATGHAYFLIEIHWQSRAIRAA